MRNAVSLIIALLISATLYARVLADLVPLVASARLAVLARFVPRPWSGRDYSPAAKVVVNGRCYAAAQP